MVYINKEREKRSLSRCLLLIILLVILEILCANGEGRISSEEYPSGLDKNKQDEHLVNELIDTTSDLKFKQILIEKTCGEKGTNYTKDGLKFIKKNLEEFSSNEYYRLKSLKKLPKIYSGKNEKLMLRSFKGGEILGSPLRLRSRVLKDEFSIPVIEDDFAIFSDELDSSINIIYPRVMNEIRYTVLLCGGGLVTMLPIVRYMKLLNSYGEYMSNDRIILQGIGIYEREKAESRRRSANIEAKYLSTLPYSDEIYTGQSIKRGGIIVGISDSIKEEQDLMKSILSRQNLDDGYQGAVLGLNIRAKEELFEKNRENAMSDAQGHFVYSSVFDFDSPNALFTMFNENLSPFKNTNMEFMASNSRNKIPHQITRAESIKNTTINRIKSNLMGLDNNSNEYSSEGSIETGAIELDKKKGETVLPYDDPVNPESIIIGKRIRPNDQISTGSAEYQARLIPESKLAASELEPIKGFPTNDKVDKVIVEIISELENQNYINNLTNLKTSKTYTEAYRRFPAYVSQKKIIPVHDQAYIFWESLRFSNSIMDKKHGVNVSNFPEKANIPSDKILPNKIPVTNKEITRSCYRLIRYFQKSGVPFIFRAASKIQGSKNYNVNFVDPAKSEYNQEYKLYAKILCNQLLPEIFVYTFHNVFELLISKREQKYFNELDEKRLELEVQQKEADALKKIRESVISRAHITPYIVEKPFERYFNAWRRSFGYNGFIVYPRIKTSVLEKMYNIAKFGPQIIEKKKKNATPDEVRSSISKALIRIIDEYFANLNTLDLFLNRVQVEEFINGTFSNLFSIAISELIKKMPIAPEMDIKSHGNSFQIKELFVSCTDYIKAILNFNKNINKISDNLGLEDNLSKSGSKNSNLKSTTDFSLGIKLLESGYESACMFVSNLLKPNIIEYSLAMGSNGAITKLAERIKSSFIHQSLTDGSSKIPLELGLKMFENSYIDVYKRVCEQHGILYFIPANEKQYFDSFPMFNEMSKRSRVELASDTINFLEIENIFLTVFESIVKPRDKGKKLELFNENIMAEFILEILIEKNVNVPSEVKSLPPFPVSHKYPWSPFFNKGLNQWCVNMINSLVDQRLLSSANDNKVFDRSNIGAIIKSTCTEDIFLKIRNNIEYEADEILRRNFAYHLATSFVYWHYYISLPKWVFYENWEGIYSSNAVITLSEEPEISLVTFILFKCIADLEHLGNTLNAREMAIIKKELLDSNNDLTRNKANKAKLNLWNNTSAKSVDGGRVSLAYFLFPNVISRDILAKVTPEDVLAFTGPHDIFWVGADEKEFLPMCLNSIEKLNEYLNFKNLNSKEEINIWISNDTNSRELFCRDIAGRFFYPRLFTNSDSDLSNEVNPKQIFSIEKLKLKRSQWLAIQEAIRRKTEKEQKESVAHKGEGENQLISMNIYSSFVLDFQESDELTNPGSFMKNCIAVFDTAMMLPEGSPYKLKILNKPNETIRDICDESMKLFYSSAVPMSWDEQQSQFNPIPLDDKYTVSRIALAQHEVILEQINEQNELGDYSIRSSERFNNLFSSLIVNIGVSDSISKFMDICSEYIWECIKRKLLFLGNGYDISNSNDLIENICKKSSYRYFISNVPIKTEEIVLQVKSGKEISEWQRIRYKTEQWKMLQRVFDSFANRFPGGYEAVISKTFRLPKYMQLANFNTSEDIFTIGEDCKRAMSYLINLHSCASNFVVIFGKVTEFCDNVSQAFKQSNS